MSEQNLDAWTVDGFGGQWQKFDHLDHDAAELDRLFDAYFAVFPWDRLPANAVGFDAGCGTGRWARRVAPRVGRLHCIDASGPALAVAKKALGSFPNCEFHECSLADPPLADGSMDFGYSLGVLHHLPDPAAGMKACARKLKPGAPFLIYMYYALENRPLAYRALSEASEALGQVISRLPFPARYLASQALAVSAYWPLARGARLLERLGVPVEGLPLSAYRDRTFYAMRTDALDRFGTRLMFRFTRVELFDMMRQAGLTNIRFSRELPYWTAVGYRE